MMQYMPYIWTAITLIAVFIVANTADLVTIWFIPAGCVSLILSLLPFEVAIWVQVLVFFAVAFILVTLSTTIFKKAIKKSPLVATNLDSVIGKEGIVTEKVNNIEGSGCVKVWGKEWSAISDDPNVVLEKGDIVIIKEIRGVKLICIKK